MRPVATFALVVAGLAVAAASVHAEAKPLSVVLDPGHGGSNIGSPGCGGIAEERITLSLARMVRKRLQKRGMQVSLTRERNVYVTLAERVRRANSTGADVFVSIHGNASPGHAERGVETYVGARDVFDVAADRAAAAEKDPVAAMRARARVRFVAAESERLARALQTHVVLVRGGDRGVRQHAWDVLDGVRVPAALIEVGFVDHPQEGEELLQADTLGRIADAIADAIGEFAAPPPPPPKPLARMPQRPLARPPASAPSPPG